MMQARVGIGKGFRVRLIEGRCRVSVREVWCLMLVLG